MAKKKSWIFSEDYSNIIPYYWFIFVEILAHFLRVPKSTRQPFKRFWSFPNVIRRASMKISQGRMKFFLEWWLPRYYFSKFLDFSLIKTFPCPSKHKMSDPVEVSNLTYNRSLRLIGFINKLSFFIKKNIIEITVTPNVSSRLQWYSISRIELLQIFPWLFFKYLFFLT